MSRRIISATAGIGALALAACSAGPAHVKTTSAAPVPTSATEIDTAFDLLMQGDEDGAKKRLKAVLARDPMNADAQLLSDSIKRDPKELLGPQNYSYTVRAGDTISGLSQRFLGNRLKAYQLLRYNDLKARVPLVAGQILRIPGTLPRPEPVRRADSAAAQLKPAPPLAAAPKPQLAAPSANPAAARQLRTAGLAALNQGAVDRAVSLLHRAAKLDPGNTLIARDLERAERIAVTVHARK